MTEVTFKPDETGPNAPPAPAADPNRPAWLPDNFTKPEDIATAYKELQAKFTQTSQELAGLKKTADGTTPPPEKTAEELAAEEAAKAGKTPEQLAAEEAAKKQSDDADAAQKAADAAGFDLAPFSEEFDTTGDVTEENRAKIADGLKSVLGDNARQLVDQYIEGFKASTANAMTDYMNAAGGEQNYVAMVSWAAEHMPKDQAEAFNRAIDSGDKSATLFAISGLKAQYEAANGRPADRITAGGGSFTGVTGYASTAEMVRDMANPLYNTDQAFRDKVAARIKAGLHQ
jgi:hypothetical protein